jgi:hypothetical protein
MQIERCSTDLDGLSPEATEYLSGYRGPLFHAPLGLRPPLGIYNVSVARVTQRFKAVLEAHERLVTARGFSEPSKPGWEESLLDEQQGLLYALFEHVEDCNNVLKVLFADSSTYYKSAHVRAFKKAIDEYRDLLGRLVNRMKHSQGRLRAIVFWRDRIVLVGYFLEGVRPDGAIGPDIAVHGLEPTAFSFSRDLRFHFVALYHISHHLGQAVARIGSDARAQSGDTSSTQTDFLSIARAIQSITTLVFPDEQPKAFPRVEILGRNGGDCIVVEYPSKRPSSVAAGTQFRVAVSYRGDGISRQFMIPYMSDG